MPSTTNYEFGNVVLVPFPFDDLTTVKRRPAVVISSRSYNKLRPALLILGITSRIKDDLVIGAASIDAWREAGLRKPSAFRPAITTCSKRLIVTRLGTLQSQDIKTLETALRRMMGKR